LPAEIHVSATAPVRHGGHALIAGRAGRGFLAHGFQADLAPERDGRARPAVDFRRRPDRIWRTDAGAGPAGRSPGKELPGTSTPSALYRGARVAIAKPGTSGQRVTARLLQRE